MKLYIDCLPCILRQTLEVLRLATHNEAIEEQAMCEALGILTRYRNYRNAPDICRAIHRVIRDRTGVDDPYRRIKESAIKSALAVYPLVRRRVSEGGLHTALLAAAAGNSMDAAVGGDTTVDDGIARELDIGFVRSDFPDFLDRLHTARTLLIIGDNAGETVFDRLIAENLPGLSVTYAVRSRPIINDATEEDALASGLDTCARILPSGSEAPGTLLDECSPEFLEIFRGADIVISKGQGNFETLSEAPREIFFLLKAKCPPIARMLGVDIGQYVFERRGTIDGNRAGC
jgi:uncharacterized protein with ATP-grasp and redox domains